MKTFETLTGAAFDKMERQEIAALSRDELVRLAFRIGAFMASIAMYMQTMKSNAMSDETMMQAISAGKATKEKNYYDDYDNQEIISFDIHQSEAELLNMTRQELAALSKDELEQLALRSQDVLKRCPIKPGCRLVLVKTSFD
jgi:hypothetical protein